MTSEGLEAQLRTASTWSVCGPFPAQASGSASEETSRGKAREPGNVIVLPRLLDSTDPFPDLLQLFSKLVARPTWDDLALSEP